MRAVEGAGVFDGAAVGCIGDPGGKQILRCAKDDNSSAKDDNKSAKDDKEKAKHMRMFRALAAGLMTVMAVAFGMLMYLFNRGGSAGLSVGLVHQQVLAVPLLVAFAAGFGLSWWNLRPE